MSYQDDEYFLPLEDQRVFGAGIKRKRVPFVQSSESALKSISAPATTSTSPAPSSPGRSIGDKYLSIVLSSRSSDNVSGTSTLPDPSSDESSTMRCDVCNLPLSPPNDDNNTDDSGSGSGTAAKKRPHETSLVHQVCLPHSQPPSAIDRRRPGYKYLSSYGWDPDARKGLGISGQGIQIPLKTKVKNDTVGLGGKVPERPAVRKKPDVKLHAKQVRKLEGEKRRKGEKLRDLFYRADDVQKYLGE